MLSDIKDVIESARRGKMFILLDDEDRENEGDLVVAADLVKREHINFMITHGRGLVCLALEQGIARRLGLNLQARVNVPEDGSYTAFATSVDAARNITTGISAAERAYTVAVMVNKNSTQQDVVTPGHMIPIIAHSDGLKARRGHTEASVAISEIAGLQGASVICEILDQRGDPMKRDEILEFANHHGLLVSTIERLVAYLNY